MVSRTAGPARVTRAALLLLLAGAAPLAAQVTVDSGAIRVLSDIHGYLFGNSRGLLGHLGDNEVRNFYTNSEAPSADRWKLGVAFDPLFGGQQSIGLSIGPQLLLPDPSGRYPHRAALRTTVRWGVTGSRDVTLQFTAPGLFKDWRLVVVSRIEQLERTQYFGAFNQVPVADTILNSIGDIYYRYSLRRATAYAHAQRRITGPLWLHAAVQARNYLTNQLHGRTTLYQADVQNGRNANDARYLGRDIRLGLVYDTRNTWDAATGGVLLEAMSVWGKLRVDSTDATHVYRRYLVGGREFLTLGSSGRTVLAFRQQVVLSSDTLPFFLALEQVNTRMPDDGVIGPRNIRLHGNRLSSNQAVLTVEVRRILYSFREQPHRHVRLWGLAYVDGGDLWEPKPRVIQSETGIWTAAVGMRAQITNTSLLGFDAGLTDEGAKISVLTYFAF